MIRPVPPPQGQIHLTFDAGTGRGDVNSNPQYFGTSDDQDHPKTFWMTWCLAETKNLAGDWIVDIANVVPCDPRCLPSDYEFSSGPTDPCPKHDDDSWTWTFTYKYDRTPPPLQQKEIFYDIFFSYRPIDDDKGSSRLVSLRRILSVDPTVLLPPKAGGGGT